MELKPHKSTYWLNSRACNSEGFDERVAEICGIYKDALQLYQQNIRVVCVDEKTGIQAIEREAPSLPMIPGSPEKIEFEYIRHGTQCLIANFEVASGQILVPSITPTRCEEDFLSNIKAVVATNPDTKWIFILDQLNTHKSESLVRWVASQIGFNDDLGINGRARRSGKGILKSMETRMRFLENKAHRIRFLFTPKHCSWMNQIEIWFGRLSRRLLKRGSFASVEILKENIMNFIRHYNLEAKPYRWTYEGKVLQC